MHAFHTTQQHKLQQMARSPSPQHVAVLIGCELLGVI